MDTNEKKQELDENLKSIYADQDGELPDFTTLEQKRGSRLRRALVASILILLLVAGTAWGGFLLWSRGIFPGSSSGGLTADIEGPTSVEAGEEVHYAIRYENRGSVPLAALELELSLPPGFELRQANPPPSDGLVWKIGSVTSGSDGEISLSGVFRAEVDTTQTLQGLFRYRPANFSSDFESIETLRVEIDNSVLNIDISGPEKVLIGDEVSYTVDVRNDGSVAVPSILVTATLPEDFQLSSSEPETADSDRAEWKIDALEPGALASIVLRGQFTSDATGEQSIRAVAGLLEDGGIVLRQTEDAMLTDVLGGTVRFQLIVDGGSEDLRAELGESLLVSIDYENAGTEAIRGLAFTLALETEDGTLPVDWSTANLPTGVRSGGTLVWDEAIRPEFALLNPGDKGVIDFVLPLLDEIDLSTHADAFRFALTTDILQVGSVESPRTIESTPIQVRIDSDFRIDAEARYFTEDGEPLGTGPHPPKVGETSTYRVFWRAENTLHPLEGIRLTTNLPPDVSWVGTKETDMGTLEFDNTTRLVTWRADKLPADIRQIGAWFDVAITPDDNDVGAYFKLTNATSGDAEDTVTGGHLSRALDILTTELPNDEHAEGGVVLE